MVGVVSHWDIGWEALVAIGTIGLAVGTGALAFVTWRLARSTAAEVRSQSRPALIPGIGQAGGSMVPDMVSNVRLVYLADQARLIVNVRNAGRGPASFVRAVLEPTQKSPRAGNFAAMAPGDEVQLVFDGEHAKLDRWQLLLDYRDLAGRTYSTAILIEGTPEPRFYDVRSFEDRPITQLGDGLPQEGVTDFTT